METGAVESAPEVVESPVGDVGPADDSSLSEDALLDKYTSPSEEAPAEPAEAKPVAEAKPEAGKEGSEQEKVEPEAVEPFVKEPETEDLKKAFKSLQKNHPETAKQIRDAWYQNQAYRESFTVPEARQMRELFPTVQDAKDARAATADMMAVDDLLGRDPATLLSYIQQRAPQSFVGLSLAMPGLLYKQDPALYRQNVSEPAVRNYHQFFESKAKEVGNQDVITAIEILREFERQTIGGNQPSREAYQADPRMMARLNQLESERAQAQSQATGTFRDTVDSDFDTIVSSEVSKIIDRSGADLSDAAKQELVERVLSDAKDKLLEDQVLQRRLDWSLQKGRHDSQHRQELNNLLTANAKRFIPQSTSRWLSWMTKEILQANAGALNKAAKVQPTRSPGGATPGGAPKQSLTKDQISKMSEDEILDAAASGLL